MNYKHIIPFLEISQDLLSVLFISFLRSCPSLTCDQTPLPLPPNVSAAPKARRQVRISEFFIYLLTLIYLDGCTELGARIGWLVGY